MLLSPLLTSKPFFLCIVAVLTIVVFWNVPMNSAATTVLNHFPVAGLAHNTYRNGDMSNATLGFEKILVINMRDRSDKRDALSLAASLTNITFNYVDGGIGADIIDKALPNGQEDRHLPPNTLGAWRGHMDAIRSIVENKMSSALILEDDADWDVRVRSQMVQFAEGSRNLLDTGPEKATSSPYGDDWDMLWLGHCVPSIKEDRKAFVVHDDASVPRLDLLAFGNEGPPAWIAAQPNHSRIIHTAATPICAFAYALSYAGAQKMLWALSVKRLGGIFDNAMADFCGRPSPENPRCLSAWPPYFHHHRVAGGAKGKNSDINAGAAVQEKPETRLIRWSARMNIERMLEGRTDFLDSYPE